MTLLPKGALSLVAPDLGRWPEHALGIAMSTPHSLATIARREEANADPIS